MGLSGIYPHHACDPDLVEKVMAVPVVPLQRARAFELPNCPV